MGWNICLEGLDQETVFEFGVEDFERHMRLCCNWLSQVGGLSQSMEQRKFEIMGEENVELWG